MAYRTPFITQTDEPAFTDCQFCSGLMLVAEWTDGEAICDRHGNTLDAVGLKRLRERIRVLSGDSEGGASLEDLARGIARRFSDLPPPPRTTAPVEPLRLSFEELWARLESGHCAALDGKPAALDAGEGRLPSTADARSSGPVDGGPCMAGVTAPSSTPGSASAGRWPVGCGQARTAPSRRAIRCSR